MQPLELVQKKHYPQKAKNACVPAALRMVLSSFSPELGEKYSEENLLSFLGTAETGSVLENLYRLEELGFRVEVAPSNLTEIHLYLTSIKKPLIAVVYTEYLPYLAASSLHAVVIVGIDEQNVFLNAPLLDGAPIVISVEEFQRAWYFWGNVIIILEPLSPENREIENRK